MPRLLLAGLLLTATACQPTPQPVPLHQGVRLASVELWRDRIAVEHAARLTACPDAPRGCSPTLPGCAAPWCWCPKVCAPRKGTGRLWVREPGACGCR